MSEVRIPKMIIIKYQSSFNGNSFSIGTNRVIDHIQSQKLVCIEVVYKTRIRSSICQDNMVGCYCKILPRFVVLIRLCLIVK